MVWRFGSVFQRCGHSPFVKIGRLLSGIACMAFLIPCLAEELTALPKSPNEHERAIIVLEEQSDFSQVGSRFGYEPGAMARRHQYVMEQLKETADRSQTSLLDFLTQRKQSGEVGSYQSHFLFNCIVVEASPTVLDQLRHWPGVESVEPDLPFTPIEGIHEQTQRSLDETGVEPGLVDIRAPQVWDLGITGAGILVSHLDGGVNGSHPALLGKWRGSLGHPWNECWLDLAGSTTFPSDVAGHGSQTMGILCGMVPGDTIGVAWGARYIAARMNFSSGAALISSALTAFEWIADPDGNPATFDDVPRVLSNSWGLEAASYPNCYNVFDAAICNCEAAGVAVFFAAGNEGNYGSETIRVPASRAVTQTQSFAVGAYDRIENSLWYLSSLGPSPCTQDSLLQIKPELVAPGRSVRSAGLGTSYATNSGTSFSVAHVAGVAALMIEANPELTADSVQVILLLTAVDKGPEGDDNAYGRGQVDAFAAVMGAIGGVGWISGHVTDPFGYPIEAEVTFEDHPQHAQSDSNGNFVLAMPAYLPLDLRITAPTFQEHVQSVVLMPGDTTSLTIALALESNLGLLTGTVINCMGQPAGGARIWFPGAGVPDVYANAQGWFRVVLTAGVYDVWADDGYCAWGEEPGVQVVSQGMTDIEIILPSNPNYLCSDPDPAGYQICDDNDPDGPDSRWIEISPTFGGDGIVYNLSDDGTMTVGLPFPVIFYGQTYHRIYVNANGNLTFNRSLTEHINVQVPRLLCPAVFAFWDDLNDNWGGDICTDYDPGRGVFVVEWSHVPRYDEMGSETFEVILFDTAAYPTTSGNTYIEVQYGDLSVTNSATVGIDAGDGSGYVQYAYNGSYSSHASPLQNGRALAIMSGDTLGGTPQIVVANPDMEVIVPPGSVVDTSVLLSNSGTAPVAYAFPPPGETSLSSFHYGRSTDADGPPYEFMDISTMGTPTGIVRDDTTSDPIPLPWLFPYCGRYFGQISICSNGYVSFTSCRSIYTYFHTQLNDDEDPFYAVFPYWNDLDPSQGGDIYTYFDEANDRFLIEWYQIRRYSSGGPNTFEIMLYRDGTIQLSYEMMSPSLVYCTVGLKGGSGADYRQLSFNQNFLQSYLLVRFDRPDTSDARLILWQDQQGVVFPGDQVAVPLRVENNSMTAVLQALSLTLTSSDPLSPTVPIQVEVDPAPDPANLCLVVIPEREGLRLHWNPLPTAFYCIYSSPLSGGEKQFKSATTDTTVWLSYEDADVRFYEVRLCSDPPFDTQPPTHDLFKKPAGDRSGKQVQKDTRK